MALVNFRRVRDGSFEADVISVVRRERRPV